MRQFVNTMMQIAGSDSVGPFQGTGRHLHWQIRRLLRRFPCELPISSSRLYVDRPGGVAALVNAMGAYDFNNMSFLQLLLRHVGGTFVDVGANIGSYTLVASEVPGARVISIEPHPTAFTLLTENVKRNERLNVTCLNVALSDRDGWLTITNEAELAINRVIHSDTGRNCLSIKSRKLKSICDEQGIVPNFVKIDVEGHELAVLEGFDNLSSAAMAIWIERGEDEAIVRWMRRFEYLGPLYVHYPTRRLVPRLQGRREDPVFLRRDLVPSLETIGFEIHGGESPSRIKHSHVRRQRRLGQTDDSDSAAAKDKTPRVCLLTNILPPYLYPVFRCLAAKLPRFRILLSAATESDRSWTPEWSGLDVIIQKSVSFISSERHPQGFVASTTRHFPYDTLVRLMSYRPDVVISAQLGLRTAQSVIYRRATRGSRLVLWVDVSEHTEKNVGYIKSQIRRILLRHADAVIATGESCRRYLLRLGVPLDRIVMVPFAGDTPIFLGAPLARDPGIERRMLYVGRLIEGKGLAPFLESLICWAQRHPNTKCELWFVGDGPSREQLQETSTPPNLVLKFFGDVPYKKLPEYYAQAGILILPTLADTWALVVNEALAAGIPVLGSLYSQAVEQLVRDGENGWTFRPDVPGETQSALDRVFLTSSDDLKRMRIAARNSVRALTPDYAARQFKEAIAIAQLGPESVDQGVINPAIGRQ